MKIIDSFPFCACVPMMKINGAKILFFYPIKFIYSKGIHLPNLKRQTFFHHYIVFHKKKRERKKYFLMTIVGKENYQKRREKLIYEGEFQIVNVKCVGWGDDIFGKFN